MPDTLTFVDRHGNEIKDHFLETDDVDKDESYVPNPDEDISSNGSDYNSDDGDRDDDEPPLPHHIEGLQELPPPDDDQHDMVRHNNNEESPHNSQTTSLDSSLQTDDVSVLTSSTSSSNTAHEQDRADSNSLENAGVEDNDPQNNPGVDNTGVPPAITNMEEDDSMEDNNQNNLTESACFLQAETDGYNNGTQTPTPGWPQWT